MTIENQLREQITKSFEPSFLKLENESYKHSVPENSETHFLAVIVSERFEGLSRIKRHQLVYSELDGLIKRIHAFSMKTLTISEAGELGVEHESPDCSSKA